MSATSAPTTFSDLYTALLNATREDTTETATVNQAKRYINVALLDMHIGFSEQLPWAERHAYLTTHPTYETGTVDIFKLAPDALIGSGTAWTTSNDANQDNMRAGGRLRISGQDDIYEIVNVSNATLATVRPQWPHGDSTDNSYTYFEDEYSLASDFLRPLSQQHFDDRASIPLIGRREFQRRYPRNYSFGFPRVATIVDRTNPTLNNDQPVRRIRFHPVPDTAEIIPYSYITSNLVVGSDNTAQEQFEDDDDQPIMPRRVRQALVLKALADWYRDKKDDTRSADAQGQYVDLMTRIVGDVEIGQQRPRLHPRFASYRSSAARPWAGGHRRFDVNNRFDRLEDL